MGNRLSKIYTRTGDDGTTGLGDGSRVSKDCDRVRAYGAVDELNSVIGLLLCERMDEAPRKLLTGVQHKLFDLGGELSIPGYELIVAEQVAALETALDTFNADLPPLKEFILPGGSRAASLCHLARTVARRAERELVTLQRGEAVNPAGLRYLNRLSDLLFVLARVFNKGAGQPDVLWRKP